MPFESSHSPHNAKSRFVHARWPSPNAGWATSRERMRLALEPFLPIRSGFQNPFVLRYGLWNGMPFLRSIATSGWSMYEQDARNITVLPCSRCAMAHLEQGKTVMFLASCSYMLHPLVAMLRKNGIPFHNPYRKTNGFWNPLRIGKKGSSANRILSLLVAHPAFGDGHRAWTNRDLALWGEWLDSKGILKDGAEEIIQARDGSRPVSRERLQAIFETWAFESLMAARDGDNRTLLDWWRTRVSADFRTRVQFPAEVAARSGPQALLDTPKVVVGTIHSVKGGQADVVYLFPDLSQAGDAHYQRFGPSRNSVIRVFYVGITRARETLYICQRETGRAATI